MLVLGGVAVRGAAAASDAVLVASAGRGRDGQGPGATGGRGRGAGAGAAAAGARRGCDWAVGGRLERGCGMNGSVTSSGGGTFSLVMGWRVAVGTA